MILKTLYFVAIALAKPMSNKPCEEQNSEGRLLENKAALNYSLTLTQTTAKTAVTFVSKIIAQSNSEATSLPAGQSSLLFKTSTLFQPTHNLLQSSIGIPTAFESSSSEPTLTRPTQSASTLFPSSSTSEIGLFITFVEPTSTRPTQSASTLFSLSSTAEIGIFTTFEPTSFEPTSTRPTQSASTLFSLSSTLSSTAEISFFTPFGPTSVETTATRPTQSASTPLNSTSTTGLSTSNVPASSSPSAESGNGGFQLHLPAFRPISGPPGGVVP